MNEPAARLHQDAAQASAALPALLAAADRLASQVALGAHGRRRAGMGEDFWQFRPYETGDDMRAVDWRRSARGDELYLKQREWNVAQTVGIWMDTGRSMDFASSPDLARKLEHARILALALTILLGKGGEVVRLLGTPLRAGRGAQNIGAIAAALIRENAGDFDTVPAIDARGIGQVVLISDFLSDLSSLETLAASGRHDGVILQILDPAERVFPYRGRAIFRSVGGTISHETRFAADLKDAYQKRLAARMMQLREISARAGWRYTVHETSASAQTALLWLHQAIRKEVA